MKFVLAKERLYWWPVTVEMPHPEKPGQWVKQSFTIQFAAIPEEEWKAQAREIAALEPAARAAREHDVLISACRNWRDVVEEDDTAIPFEEATLRQAMQQPWFRAGLYNAWARSQISEAARTGN